MAMIPKLLGQVNPADTVAVALLTISPVPADKTYLVTEIVVCNKSAIPMTYSIYHDIAGEVWDDSNKLMGAVSLAANTTERLSVKWFIPETDSLGVSNDSGSASELVFTIYGFDQDI